MQTEGDFFLVFYYNEAMIQFGFIVLFSQLFTLAPLFSLLTNLLEIKIKLDGMTKYSRRMRSEGARDIGAWMGVLEIMSFLAIPINVAIIMFTKQSRTKDANGVEVSVNSAFNTRLTSSESGWTESTVILFAVLIEHFMMFAKVFLNLLIVDVPVKVETDEKKRRIDAKAAHVYLEGKQAEAVEKGLTFECMVK